MPQWGLHDAALCRGNALREGIPVSKPAAKAVMPIIAVASVDAIRNFYVDTLGFDHVMGVVGKDGQFDFCTVVLGGARIMFARAQGDVSGAKPKEAKQPVEIYLEVGDVQGYHDKLKKAGVKLTEALTMQWWGDRTFKVRDPLGYEIWFYQTVGEPKPPAGAKIV
jgi:uncharacterized glyoxalase superfamily protein PhnB